MSTTSIWFPMTKTEKPYTPKNCGSIDRSLGHRYWCCRSIRPLIREAFNIIGRPPDLQAWIFGGSGLEDDALSILASAKLRIYRYFVQNQYISHIRHYQADVFEEFHRASGFAVNFGKRTGLSEEISGTLTLNHRVSPTTQLLDLPIVGGCRFLRPPNLLAPSAGLGLEPGIWATPTSSAPRSPSSLTPRPSPPSAGRSWQRIFMPHPDHPESAGPSCPAFGSTDVSLGHRYWSCASIRPLVRETP
ncbi:hypothetical protein LAZ67_21001253 [Cordylochernes scorpioides]|uniref:Uncharacterized protein n=1 Tax=Cordylochernes scorpioides TaxID=51811 RepID=A0ABY6LNK5_9ARAC|nr:hypothetical protein LAZ67_21001253 [Cordylochernes scorpioides]